MIGTSQREPGAQTSKKKAPSGQKWKTSSNKISKVVLDYKSEHEINIHESILIKINVEQINQWGRRDKSTLQKDSNNLCRDGA